MNERKTTENAQCKPINIGECYKPVCCLNLHAGVGGNRKDWPQTAKVMRENKHQQRTRRAGGHTNCYRLVFSFFSTYKILN